MHTVCLFGIMDRVKTEIAISHNIQFSLRTFLLVDKGEGLLLHLLIGKLVEHC